MWVLSGLLIAFVLLPLVRLAASSSPASLRSAAADSEVRDAILLSLKDAAITAVIATVFGVLPTPCSSDACESFSRPR